MTPAKPRFSAQSIKLARAITYILDDCRFDPILGLFFPLIGDAICGIFSLSIVAIAWRHKVHRLTLARMMLNVSVDAAVGAIPLIGDLFDFLFRANSRNLKLLERNCDRPTKYWLDGLVLALAAILCLSTLLAPFYLVFYIFHHSR